MTLQEMQQETEEVWRLFGLPLAFHALGRRGESDAALATLKSKYAGEMAYQIAEVPSAARPTWPSSGSNAPTTSATAASRTSRAAA